MAAFMSNTWLKSFVLQGVIKIACTRDGFVAEIENNQDFYKQKPLKIINSPKTRKKKRKLHLKLPHVVILVRWARLELAQAYAHYPLKVACLPFHHHRLFDLGLQRYDKNLNLQIFLQLFSVFLKKSVFFSFLGLFYLLSGMNCTKSSIKSYIYTIK